MSDLSDKFEQTMATYRVSKSFKWQGTITERVTGVCRMFGLTKDRLAEQCFTHCCKVDINAGDIIYITGPSGAGKSVLLTELAKCIPASERINLADVELSRDKTLIDCFDDEWLMSLRLLSVAGLNDCFTVLNQPNRLSTGQQYRFRLAMALAAGRKFVFADEFCSGLDSVSALVLAYSLHKFARQSGTTFILASSRSDIILDLAPDVLVETEQYGPTEVIYKRTRCR
jgi:ABC-type ATPase with predicted acetyltransferase domain